MIGEDDGAAKQRYAIYGCHDGFVEAFPVRHKVSFHF
jgi:hypothetical protein